jgi:hypothetical protein
MMVDFAHLSKAEFEELCYDLIVAKGFTNVDWRKGTGKPTSPSDNGRDIEADKISKDIDNSTNLLKYFFECKHFEQGVPPKEIEGAITWAEAERPYCLIIIASNFLSNPCKTFIEKYKENNKPKFQIRTWENKLLEELLSEEKNICLKWKITLQEKNYRYINKYHLAYTTKPCLNTIDYLFSILDNYDIDIRDTLLEWIYYNFLINLELEKIEKYEDCKEHIKQNKKFYKDPIFVHQIITETLAWAYHMGDIAEKNNMRNKLINFNKIAEEKYGPEESKGLTNLTTKQLNGLDEQFDKYNKYYNDFCDNVVFDLLSEPFLTNIKDEIKIAT